MPNYDYVCLTCSARVSETFPITEDAPEKVTCTSCDKADAVRAFDAEGVNAGVGVLRDDFSDGYTILQLPPNCPDRHVTSAKQRERAYLKNGIDPDTHKPFPGRENESGAHRWKKSSPKG